MATDSSSREKEVSKLLFALMKGSRRSDREIAKSIGISQPSVSRKRMQLESKGFIQEYTITPDLQKMGYEIAVFTFLDFHQPLTPETYSKARQWVGKQPSVLFWADGEGPGMGSVMVSVHKGYADFSRLMTQFRLDWQTNIKTIQNFYVSLGRKELFIRPFSFRYLEGNERHSDDSHPPGSRPSTTMDKA